VLCSLHVKRTRTRFLCVLLFRAHAKNLNTTAEIILVKKVTEKEEKEGGNVVADYPCGAGVNAPQEEKEREQFEERLNYAIEAIGREMPGVEIDTDEHYPAISLWIPYVDEDSEGILQDFYEKVGVLYLIREDPESHEHYLKSKEEIINDVKALKEHFLRIQTQICEIMNQFEEASKSD